MKKEDVKFVEQIIKSLEEANDALDEFYNKNDFQSFNKAKKLILQIQNKIPEIVI